MEMMDTAKGSAYILRISGKQSACVCARARLRVRASDQARD